MTNAIGPIITAQKLLQTRIPIGTITFMSSDSGSAGSFRSFEDGYDGVFPLKKRKDLTSQGLPLTVLLKLH